MIDGECSEDDRQMCCCDGVSLQDCNANNRREGGAVTHGFSVSARSRVALLTLGSDSSPRREEIRILMSVIDLLHIGLRTHYERHLLRIINAILARRHRNLPKQSARVLCTMIFAYRVTSKHSIGRLADRNLARHMEIMSRYPSRVTRAGNEDELTSTVCLGCVHWVCTECSNVASR